LTETLTRNAPARGWRLSLSQLWVVVALSGILIVLDLTFVRSNDFWWHVRAGQWIVANGRIPAVDLFSYTRLGTPFTYEAWLMEVVLYLLLRSGGLPLVIYFHALAITAAYALLFRTAHRAGGGDARWAVLVTLAAAALGANNWSVRPQTISFPFFALTLFLLEASARRQGAGVNERQGSRALWALPPLFALWANAHGGFVFGLALLGAGLLGRLVDWLKHRQRFPTRLVLVAGLCAAATCLTPSGLGMVNYVLGFVRHPITQSLNVEFMPPTVRTGDGLLLFGFSACLAALLAVSRYRPTAGEALRLLLFGGLALTARRNVVWFGFVAAPAAAACLGCWAAGRGTPRAQRAGRPRLNQAFAALLGLLAFVSLPWLRPQLPLPKGRQAYLAPETPVRAVAFLNTLPTPLRLVHSEADGSYLIWASPGVPVFIDTRIELYPKEQWDDYIAVFQARYDWEAILERYGADTLLLERRTAGPLIAAAAASPDWRQLYDDDQAVIYQRRGLP